MGLGYVLITGASSGFGADFARVFGQDGYPLILVARRKDKLEQLAEDIKTHHKVDVRVYAKDLTSPDACDSLFEELEQSHISLDVLINNAGYGDYGEFKETDLQKELKMIQLNISALTHLSKRAIQQMSKRKKGRILNVASTAAFQPGPLMAVYYATKAYVLSFSEALANELRGTGIDVSVLCPGAAKTEFANAANVNESKLFQGSVMDSKTVVNIGYEGFKRGDTIIIPGFRNKVIAQSNRFLPRKWITNAVRNIQERAH